MSSTIAKTVPFALLLGLFPGAGCSTALAADQLDVGLPPIIVEKKPGSRPRISIDLRKIVRRPAPGRPAPAPSRRAPSTRRAPAPSRPPVIVSAPPAPLPADADGRCLETLEAWGVPYRTAGTVRGVKTPIEVTGAIRGVRLVARAGRGPIMDCELARALAEAAPIFRNHGVTGLSFSGTYVYRTVKGTSKLSGHAYGLAIDVHGFDTGLGRLDVERDYPKDGSRWSVPRGNVGACIGAPARAEGRIVRALACELRAHSAFRMIISPDDNYDHRNHLHLESYPSRPTELLSSSGDKPAVVHRGRHSRRSRR